MYRGRLDLCPSPRRHAPWAGHLPSLPCSSTNRIFGDTNRTTSLRGTYVCHQGAEVRSGTRAIPLPCSKNFSSHGTRPLRPPNGAFIHTKPFQLLVRLSCVRKASAGIHDVWPHPGLATSMSNRQPSASKIRGGVYHSSEAPTLCSWRAITCVARS